MLELHSCSDYNKNRRRVAVVLVKVRVDEVAIRNYLRLAPRTRCRVIFGAFTRKVVLVRLKAHWLATLRRGGRLTKRIQPKHISSSLRSQVSISESSLSYNTRQTPLSRAVRMASTQDIIATGGESQPVTEQASISTNAEPNDSQTASE